MGIEIRYYSIDTHTHTLSWECHHVVDLLWLWLRRIACWLDQHRAVSYCVPTTRRSRRASIADHQLHPRGYTVVTVTRCDCKMLVHNKHGNTSTLCHKEYLNAWFSPSPSCLLVIPILFPVMLSSVSEVTSQKLFQMKSLQFLSTSGPLINL